MKLVPSESDLKLASKIHREFSVLPESGHIATEFALGYLSALIAARKPRSVLEFGAGIGTITQLLMEHPWQVSELISTEGHPVCVAALSRNLRPSRNIGWHLVSTFDQITKLRTHFDLVIFDDFFGDDRQYSVFNEGTLCFVEGNRRPTRDTLAATLAKRGLAVSFTNFNRGKRWRLAWRKKPSLIPLPKITHKPVKGCFVGQVTRLPQ
jgi:hypothetical protein